MCSIYINFSRVFFLLQEILLSFFFFFPGLFSFEKIHHPPQGLLSKRPAVTMDNLASLFLKESPFE